MHMANELLSVPVAASTLGIAAAALGFVCRKAREVISPDKFALMGILGAFVFAAQMVNFQLPAMPGTSGHMVGAVLLAIILGPHAAAVVISSVVIVQCLIFQDGGLLALGCNLINMALVPSYLGHFIYRAATHGKFSSVRAYAGAVLACVTALEAGAILVPVEASLSGVLVVPFSTFLITMMGVHFLIGLMEALITVAVLGYLQQVRPDIVADSLPGRIRVSRKAVLATLVVFTVVTAGGLSLLASGLPDGLEWSYLERPENHEFEPMVSNQDKTIAAVQEIQNRYTPLPDYTVRTSGSDEPAAGWTSFAGIVGALTTMALVWTVARSLRKKRACEKPLVKEPSVQ